MAPNRWDAVLVGGQTAGFTVEELFERGAAAGQQAGGLRPLPPADHVPDPRSEGQGAGVRGARPAARGEAEYLNSPESELYRKSHTLYGIDLARTAIAKAKRAIVVEGYTDVMALHQAGVTETVAIMGTAITPEQLQMLGGLDRLGGAGARRRPRGRRRDDPRAEGGGRPGDGPAGGGDARGRGSRRHAGREGRSSASASWWSARSTCRASGCGPRSGGPTWATWRGGSGRWPRWRRC